MQHLYAVRIHQENDTVTRKVATADFMGQVSESLRILNLVIEEMVPAHYGEQNEFSTRIKFRFTEGQIPFLITPLVLAPQFWTSMGNMKKS